MGFRYRKSFGSGPFRINLSKSGIGYSVGGKGFRYAQKANGGTRTTLSIPGSGISYVDEASKTKRGTAMKPTSKKTPDKQKTQIQTETLRIEGLYRFSANIKKLAKLNPDWTLTPEEIIAAGKAGQRIFQCKFVNSPVQLIPELDNAEDPNAVAVTIAGLKVGYVSKSQGEHIAWILKNCSVQSISCGMFGGKYKVVDEEGNISSQQCNITVTVRLSFVNSTQPAITASQTENLPKQKKSASKKSKKKKPIYKRWWFWAIIVTLLLGSCGGNDAAAGQTAETEGHIGQLEYEGFTSEQASYGVDNYGTGLGNAQVAVADQQETQPSTSGQQYTYILNISKDQDESKFHEVWCSSVKRMNEENKLEFTGTRDEVIAMGYRPCKNCNP